MARTHGFLRQDSLETPDEYTMARSADLVWITVGGLSVHIIQEDDEVRVDIFSLNHEDDEPIASCKASAEEYPVDEEQNVEQDATPLY